MNTEAKIFVAGHKGLVGTAIMRSLRSRGYKSLIVRDRRDLDLTDQKAVMEFFCKERPECVIDAAAKVGGILANNQYPADFIRDNLFIQSNLIDAAYRNDVRKFMFLGSSCIYPKLAAQPMAESSLLTGPLEPTNEAYAIAKIAGIKMCQAYRRQYGFDAVCAMPTNLYGPCDNFSLHTSHVVPALIRKFHEAKVSASRAVTIWGTGTPRREFLYVDDMADAVVFLMEHFSAEELVNVGIGSDVSIRELAEAIAEVTGFEGQLEFDLSKPDGTPQKLLDVSRLSSLGWQAKTSMLEGLRRTYAWFCANQSEVRG